MSKKFLYGTTAAAALLVSVLFAAVPTSFVPDSTFQGSTLKGWHVLGQAGWRAEKGEIIGSPKKRRRRLADARQAVSGHRLLRIVPLHRRLQDRCAAPCREDRKPA